MVDIGSFFLVGATFLSIYGLVIGVIGAIRGRNNLVRSSANALYGVCGLSVSSLIALGVLFLRHDYRYGYVWKHSNNTMQPMYLISSIWGGMEGSLLLWAVMLTIYGAVFLRRSSAVPQQILNWTIPVLHGSSTFFLSVVTFLTNPFRQISVSPADGNGLNPLLQNPSMVIHPPCLYSGFTGMVVPFALALGVLLSGSGRKSWAQLSRRWTLVAWGFLTAGIVLGGNWAYIELGWGGFWAWDPVENSSFLPWLSATAFLHSIMVEERRGMLRIWNIFLAILSYLLAVFGTFLTRSGVVQSVHAFANTDIGWVFLAYIGGVSLLSVFFIVLRWPHFRAENKIESFFSREAIFLFNNLLLLAICFATFWGVMFPVFSEALGMEKIAVGPPFFNKVNVPLFLVLLFLMSVGPLVAWRKASVKNFISISLRPFLIASAITILFLVLDSERIFSAFAFGLSTLVLFSIFGELHRAMKLRRSLGVNSNLVQLVRSKPQRYGGLLVHVGVAVMAIAITASMGYKVERDVVLKLNERYEIGRFALVLQRLEQRTHENFTALESEVQVSDRKSSEVLGMLFPERRLYKNDEATTEVDIRMTPRDDLYLALAGVDDNGNAILKIFINPLQIWLWVGAVIVLLGTGIVLTPRLVTVKAEERVGEEVAV